MDVTHPVTVALLLNVTVVVQDISAATLKVHAHLGKRISVTISSYSSLSLLHPYPPPHLVVATLGPLVHHARVGDVRAKPEVHAITFGSANGRGDD